MAELPKPPIQRPRRLRRNELVRDAVADVRLTVDDLIMPLFVSNADTSRPVESLPEVRQLTVDDALEEIRRRRDLGIRWFILFGVTDPADKDAAGMYACDPGAPVNRLCRAVREAGLDAVVVTDLCFCEYTDHGHCGVLCDPDPGWVVDNDRTLATLAEAAAVQAGCGADVIAPSGMMDGQVAAVRRALDAGGYGHVAVMSYAVKYASNLYGPFREAGGTRIASGDRRGYQMDYRRTREWRIELDADVREGADIVMVKPATTYLDILAAVRSHTALPVAAYHVSGEYAMIHAAADRGWVDLASAAVETTYAIKRAGADLIVTYFAPRLAQWLTK